MADFFATIIDFVRGIIEPIFRFIFESILWVIIFFISIASNRDC